KTKMPCFGLIAEEVAAVNPDLVLRDEKGEMYSVRYEQINAMLLNEFLKEHKKVEEQQASIAEQQATITQLKKDFGATIAQLTAFGSPYPSRPNGSASEIRSTPR